MATVASALMDSRTSAVRLCTGGRPSGATRGIPLLSWACAMLIVAQADGRGGAKRRGDDAPGRPGEEMTGRAHDRWRLTRATKAGNYGFAAPCVLT
jgi:hypothetical protein